MANAVSLRPAEDKEAIEKIVLGRLADRNAATRCMKMAHSRGGTKENPTDPTESEAEVNVFIHRASMKEKLRKPAHFFIGGTSHQAISRPQPFHRLWISGHRIVAEAQKRPDDFSLPCALCQS